MKRTLLTILLMCLLVVPCYADGVGGDGIGGEIPELYGQATAFTSGDTTPNITTNTIFRTANSGATTISDFDAGGGTIPEGRIIYVIIDDANTTLDCTSSGLKCNNGVDYSAADGDLLMALYDNDGDWLVTIGGASGAVAGISVTDDEATNDNHEVVFTTDNTNLESDGDFTYNPSTGIVAATQFSGGGGSLTSVNAATITVSDDEATNDSHEVVFTTNNSALESDGNLSYNPSTGTLSATQFSGGGASLTSVDAATGDSATDFFDDGEIVDARIADNITVASATDITLTQADPDIIFDDTDGADGIIVVDAADADDAVMGLGVDDSNDDDQIYLEIDGVTERIEALYPLWLGDGIALRFGDTSDPDLYAEWETAAGAQKVADTLTWYDSSDNMFAYFDPANGVLAVKAVASPEVGLYDSNSGTGDTNLSDKRADQYAGGLGADFTTVTEDSEVSDMFLYYMDAGTKRTAVWVDGSSDLVQVGYAGQDGKLGIFSEQGETDYLVSFAPHATMTESTAYLLPAADGDSGQVLHTDGSGNLSWGADDTAGAPSWDTIADADADKAFSFADNEITSFDFLDTNEDMFTVTGSGAFEDVSVMRVAQVTGDATNGTVLEVVASDANVDPLVVSASGKANALVVGQNTGVVTIAGVAEDTSALTITAGDITITDGDLVVTAGDCEFGEDVTITGSILGVVGVDASGTVSGNLFTPDEADGADIGTSDLEFSDVYLADGSIIKFGADQDVTLTHVADTGIQVELDDKIMFGDTAVYIHSDDDGYLDLEGDTGIRTHAPIDVADEDISSVDKLEGVDAQVYIDLGADTVAEITADGYVEVNAPYLQMDTDGAIIKMGDDGDVTLTHVADTGLTLNLDLTISGNDITFGNGETISNATDGDLELTAPEIDLEYDDAAYLTIATADGGATTISQTSDGQDKIILGDGLDATQVIIPSGPDDMADDNWSGIAIKGPCGEAVAQFEVVTWTSADNEFMLANAEQATGLYPARGIAVGEHNDGWETANGEELTVMVQGVIRNDDWAWGTVGGAIYLDDTAAGGISQTAPAESNDCIQVVGWAISDDQAYFNFSGHWLLVE